MSLGPSVAIYTKMDISGWYLLVMNANVACGCLALHPQLAEDQEAQCDRVRLNLKLTGPCCRLSITYRCQVAMCSMA